MTICSNTKNYKDGARLNFYDMNSKQHVFFLDLELFNNSIQNASNSKSIFFSSPAISFFT